MKNSVPIIGGVIAAVALTALAAQAQQPARKPTAKPDPAAALAGKYNASLDGGNGTITVTGTAPTYRMVFESSCGETISGPAQSPKSGVLILSVKAPDGDMCRITMTRNGAAWSIEESGCSYYRGGSCGLSGTARKMK